MIYYFEHFFSKWFVITLNESNSATSYLSTPLLILVLTITDFK